MPTAKPGRILGHEGVGVIDSVGKSLTLFKKLINKCTNGRWRDVLTAADN
ncbi:MAG: alcohol dehydrogenase catalytic domain-containing protein [Aestuariivirga sp.]